jgi:SAM-dependent methyltransferase
MDVSNLSFNSLLLLERVQLSWFPKWVPERELGIALRANPVVAWYFIHKCPEIADWVDRVIAAAPATDDVRAAEVEVMRQTNDLLVYVVDPSVYDERPFLAWDSSELTRLADFSGATVLDIGSGTGRLALVAARTAAAVFAVEPVENLRRYLLDKSRAHGLRNVHPVDGLVTDIPFPDDFADITIGGHVFGDHPEDEVREILRVTRPGGAVIACPGTNDVDNEMHRVFLRHGFEWARFEEPEDGTKRKYWKQV